MFLQSSDLTISAINSSDPTFRIPVTYVEPSPYPLSVDLWRYKVEVIPDLNSLLAALYGSIEPLLAENIKGYSVSRPNGLGIVLKNRSEFTLNLLNTARKLLSLIGDIKECLGNESFETAVVFPLCVCKEGDIIYELKEF